MTEGRNMRAILAFAACSAVCFLCALFVAAPAALAAPTQSDIPYSQIYTTDDPSVPSDFTYTLVADSYTATTPMPAGSIGDTYTFTVDGNATGSITIDTTTSPEGTYTYKIQDASVHQPNYTYEQRTYTVKVYVDGTHTVTTIERDSDGTKVARAEFDPSYTAPVDGSVTVEKGVANSDIRPGGTIVYSFTVTSTGTTDAVGVWVKDHLPLYTNYVSSTDGGVFVPDASRGSVNWFITRLAPGQSVTMYFTVSLDSSMPVDAEIKNVGKFEVTNNETPPDFNDEPQNTPGSNGGETNTVSVSRASNASKTVKTGDTGNLVLMGLCSLAAAGAVLTLRQRRMRAARR